MKTLAKFVLLPLSLLIAGCTVPVAAGLDESDANRIVVSLDHASIDSTKEADPVVEGRFRVVVMRDDAARALVTMQGEGLPRPKPAGVLDAMDKGALVPSRAAEHAQYIAGLSGDLERTLEGIDGVLSARVHLNVPDPDPLRENPNAHGTASVLVEHRGTNPPIAVTDVQQIVAGGVSSLAPAAVAVIMIPRGAVPGSEGLPLAHVGPIAVARTSMRALQIALMGLMALVAVLAGATLVLYARLARMRADGASAAKLT